MELRKFAEEIERGEKEGLIRADLGCEANMKNAETHTHQGRRWTRVDVGSSGRYMIDKDGKIFGIKAYGVPHYGYYYGTLDNPSPSCFRGRY